MAEIAASAADFESLLRLGGFPEPFLGGSATRAKRWSIDYRDRLLREDISVLESIHDLGSLERLVLRLPELVGSPLSVNSLREELQLNHQTVSRWLDILERMYAIFRVPPFGGPRIRAVKKAQKHYHFDWSLVPQESLRFENLVASHLLKWVHFQRDTAGRSIDLRYFRDVDGREVDFVLVEGRDPILLVECKWSEERIAPSLKYLSERYPMARAMQITAHGKRDVEISRRLRILPARKFLATLF